MNKQALSFLFFTIVLFSCSPSRKLQKKRYINHTYTALKKTLNDAEVKLLNDTIRVIFKSPVLFEYKQAWINPSLHPDFEKLAYALKIYAKTQVLIVGYTDSIGGDKMTNRILSQRRADSARNLLEYYQVPRERIDTWGFGAKEPIASNKTETGRAANRRVQFIILYSYDNKKKKST